MSETQTSGDEDLFPARSSVHQKRSEAEPSCVSMKSDRSMDPPVKFKSGDTRPGLSSIHQKRSEAECSCVSIKSDMSTVSYEVLNTFRSNLMKFECLYEGTATERNPTLLNEIYTELYITESERGEISNEHEVRQIETQSRRAATEDTAIKLESNQTLLRKLLTQTGSCSYNKEETVQCIKQKIRENRSPEKSINLFHCLNELGDDSLMQEIQDYLKSGEIRETKLSSSQWSALVYVLLTSEQKMDVFDLKQFIGAQHTADEVLQNLFPVVKESRSVR
ncbi:uncharacterized protein, partial [Sinocyclocheilus grahami]|uniref:uncharacterized protein n=1 Tax=Sinocyclocheilus grahami TaxID=75366 RepID=UPI0007AC79DD